MNYKILDRTFGLTAETQYKIITSKMSGERLFLLIVKPHTSVPSSATEYRKRHRKGGRKRLNEWAVKAVKII
jgi:hypothetical protein